MDPRRIAVAGYSLGGLVAAHAGLLDSRISAVGILAGLSPWANHTMDSATGGLARYAALTSYTSSPLVERASSYPVCLSVLTIRYLQIL